MQSFTATQTVELIGGPCDGERHAIPSTSSEIIFEDLVGGHYRYCPHASAHRTDGVPRFIHNHIDHDFFAQ